MPAVKMFFGGRGYNDPSTLGDIADAIVYFGYPDSKVPAVKP